MLIRFPRPTHPLLAVLRELRDGVAHLLRHIHEHMEVTVANFDALNAKLDEHNTAVTDAVARVDEDVAALKAEIEALQLDTEDQAKVDAATERVQASIDALKAVDPVKAEEPAESEPVDGTEPGDEFDVPPADDTRA